MDLEYALGVDSHSSWIELCNKTNGFSLERLDDLLRQSFQYIQSCSVSFEEFQGLTKNVTSSTISSLKQYVKGLAGNFPEVIDRAMIYPGGKNILQTKLSKFIISSKYHDSQWYSSDVDFVYQAFLAAGILYPFGNQITAHIFMPFSISSTLDVGVFNNQYSFMDYNTFYSRLIRFLQEGYKIDFNSLKKFINSNNQLIQFLQMYVRETESQPVKVAEFTNPFTWS